MHDLAPACLSTGVFKKCVGLPHCLTSDHNFDSRIERMRTVFNYLNACLRVLMCAFNLLTSRAASCPLTLKPVIIPLGAGRFQLRSRNL